MDYLLKGTKISLTTPELVLNKIKNCDYESTSYICLFGLYPLTQSFKNKELRDALNNSYLNPLHGKNLEFYLRLKGNKDIEAVDGVFLLENLLNEPLSHYFYGAQTDTLKIIENKISSEYPDAIVHGYKEPPMVHIDEIKNNKDLKNDFIAINQKKPNIVWVGLGGVKQDLIMYHYSRYLDKSLLIGVGAVFDYFAGNLTLSSKHVKNSGFRWLHRLIQQPKMLNKKVEIMKILISSAFKKEK